jgi:tetratricopeptide (TPR) repeat protein
MAAVELSWLLSRVDEAIAHASLAAEHARAAGEEAVRQQARGYLAMAHSFGGASADAMQLQLEEIEREPSGGGLAVVLDMTRGFLAALRGHESEARSQALGAVAAAHEMGLVTLEGGVEQSGGQIEMMLGNWQAARSALERSDRILASVGEQSYRSTTLADLAIVEQQLGDREAARLALERAEQLSAPEDLINFASTHGVRALLSLDAGDLEAAERWARSGLDYADRTQHFRQRSRNRLWLSRVLAARGQKQEAIAAAQEALDIYVRKQDQPGTARAQAWLAELRVEPSS